MNIKTIGFSLFAFFLFGSLTLIENNKAPKISNHSIEEIENEEAIAIEEETSSASNYLNYNVPLSQLVDQPVQAEKFSLLVQKSSYSLFVKYNGRVIKSYPCVFGENPVNDKLKQGDNCTPEGNFSISDIREHFIWGYFLAFDYPNGNSWEKHNRAKQDGRIEQEANIGGDVGIHGVVDGLESLIDSKNNWTEGCVSMKNTDVSEIAQNLAAGTPIKIVY